MRTRWLRVGAVATLVLATLGVATVAKLGSSDAVTLTAANVRSVVATCVPQESGIPADVLGPMQQCLTRTMVSAAVDGGKPALEQALVSASDLLTPDICHTAAHVAGAELTRTVGLSRALEVASTPSCNSGAIHGVYDGAAKLPEASRDWKMLVSWCVTKGAENKVACGDALGHAAYDSSKDRIGSFKLCELFGAAENMLHLVSECSEGVIMQTFQPASRPQDVIHVPNESLHLLCSDLASATTLDRAVRAGCFTGVGFIAGNQTDLTQEANRPGTPTEAELASDRSAVTNVVALCDAMSTDKADTAPCRDRIYSVIAFRYPSALAPGLCSDLAGNREECVARIARFYVENKPSK